MSYGADFANADAGNAPLDPTIMIGADPFFWGAILLGLIAALLLGWYLGARSDARRADAAQSIWKEIHDAARSAMGANDNALKERSEHLRKVVRERLGNTLKLTEGLSEGFGALENAIDGQGAAHPGGNHGHGSSHDDDDGPDHGQGETVHAGGGGGGAATANITIVTGAPAETSHTPGRHGPGHAPGHDPHATRVLTHREQTDALRLAVARFAEHWRDEPARLRELRGAHAELSNPSPARPARPAISGTRAKH